MEINQENIDNIKKIFEGIKDILPEPKKEEPVIEKPETTCVCGKRVFESPEVLHKLNTGIFTTLNDVCKGCAEGEKIDKETARIVCSRCKRVMLRITPSIDPVNKFEFKAGHTYHLDSCALCNPGPAGEEKEYKIIEALIWNKKHGIKA